MDLSDATKMLLDRIQKLEPEIATKVMGCILIQDLGEREMIRLAYAPENLLENLVQKTKAQLGHLAKSPFSNSLSPPIPINSPPVSEVPLNYMSFSPFSSRPYTYPPTFRVPHSPYWDPNTPTVERQQNLNSEIVPFGDSKFEQLVGYEDQLNPGSNGVGYFPGDIFYTEGISGNLRMRRNRHLPNLIEIPAKTCPYYNKGFCKHGSTCRYIHRQDKFTPFFSSHELGADDHLFSPGSLEKLEVEICELLKSKGEPISIASLPMLYCEKYGRMLQADGYLTESQRHGRAGYSLTKLLARLKTIRLIDRPHGQHSVILAEDASKHNFGHQSERNDPGLAASGSRQIYLTFPAESTFTEEDVSNYFGEFGNVEDVRIPCQQKRMFGFVTFGSANTVRTILAKGNPHLVRGSRVLVKPYREKSKLVERKYIDKNDHVPRCEAPRFLRRQLIEQREQALEMDCRRLSEFQFSRKYTHNPQFNGYNVEELYSLQNASCFTEETEFNYLLDGMNNGSISNDWPEHLDTDYTEQESSQGVNLPEYPFASARRSGISTVI